MPEFLLEVYVPRADCAVVRSRVARFGRAASEHSRTGSRVRIVRSIFAPDDETWFLLVAADGADSVCEVARRAGLSCERMVATSR